MKKPVTVNKSYTFNIQLYICKRDENVYQVQKVHKISNKELLIRTKKVKINKINKTVHKK